MKRRWLLATALAVLGVLAPARFREAPLAVEPLAPAALFAAAQPRAEDAAVLRLVRRIALPMPQAYPESFARKIPGALAARDARLPLAPVRVPEPSSALLILAAAASLRFVRRRRVQ